MAAATESHSPHGVQAQESSPSVAEHHAPGDGDGDASVLSPAPATDRPSHEMWQAVCNGYEGGVECPSARTKHSATLLAGKIYLFGGRNGNIPLKDLWTYTLNEGKWEKLKPTGDTPPSLQEHSAVAYQGNIYVFGGEVGFSSTETPLWMYDVQKNHWRKIPSRRGAAAPRGRRSHSALVYQGCMLIYGGYQDLKGSLNDIWAYYFETESWHLLSSNAVGGTMPSGRHKHSAVIHDGSMWVYGGMQDLNDKADFWKLNISSSQWQQIKCKFSPGPLHSHAACRLPGYMLIFGGESNGQPTNELWRFHFATESWEKIHSSGIKPQPRSESVAIAVSELHIQGEGSTPLHSGVRGRSRPPRCPSIDRSVRHSSYIPSNKVSPFEKTYVFNASTNNYMDGSPAQSYENSKNPISPTQQAGNFFKEISKLSQINISRLGHNKCSYSVLTSTNDSTESLVNNNLPQISQNQNKWNTQNPPVKNSMVKSQSAHVINKRKAINGLISPTSPEGNGNPTNVRSIRSRQRQSIEEWRQREMTREPISVPNFTDLTLPTPVLSPVEAARLVFLDSEEEEGYNNDIFDPPIDDHDIVQTPAPAPSNYSLIHDKFKTEKKDESYSSQLSNFTETHTYENVPKVSIVPKSQSVRFQNYPDLEEASDENSTSDYASIEGVNKISSASNYSMSARHSFTPLDENEPLEIIGNMKHSNTSFGFCNPNYMGPDVQSILVNGKKRDSSEINATQIAKMLNTPDSGIQDSRSDSRQMFLLDDMVEMKDFNSGNSSRTSSRSNNSRLPPKSLTIEYPCSPYQHKDSSHVKYRAKSASRAENYKDKEESRADEAHDMTCFTSAVVIPLYVFIVGGKEHGQVNVFKRPLSMWKYQLF